MSYLNARGAGTKVETSLKKFHTTFAGIDVQWADAARQDFEETYLAPMDPEVRRIIAAIGRLSAVFSSAERDCSSDYGTGNE